MRFGKMFLVALVIGLLVGLLPWFVGAAELTKLQVQLSWTNPTAEFAPYVLGKEKGFYSQAGFEIELLPANGSPMAATIIGSGKVPLGFVDAAVMLAAREKGLPLKALAAAYQRNTAAVFYLKNSGIKEPKDFRGKTFLSDQSYRHLHLLAWLRINGLSPEKDVVIQDFRGGTGGRIQMLLSKKVDAITMVFYRVQDQQVALKDIEGIKYFLFKDHGVDSISKVLVANETFMKTNPKMVSGFVQASKRAWEYALKNPAETIKALVKNVPDLNEKAELLSFEAGRLFMKSPATQGKPWGWMALEDWERTQRILVEAGFISGKMPVKDAFTNEFITTQ